LVIIGLLLIGALAWGVSHITRAMAVQPMATPASPSAVEETAGEDGFTTAPAEEPYPVTWTVRLGQDAHGRAIGIVTDPAVHEAVREGFLEAWEWAFRSESPHNAVDVERYFAPLPEGVDDWVFQPDARYWYGLERVIADLDRENDEGILTHVSLEGGAWVIEITRFSTNGARAVVRGRYEGGTCILQLLDVSSGELLTETESPCAVYTAGLIYDTMDGRWKIATLRQVAPQAGSAE
jgi:hypothetical protein